MAFVYDVSQLSHLSVMAGYLEKSNNTVLLPDQFRFCTCPECACGLFDKPDLEGNIG